MIHEEVDRQSLSLGAKVAKLTLAELRKAIEKLLADLEQQSKNALSPHRLALQAEPKGACRPKCGAVQHRA